MNDIDHRRIARYASGNASPDEVRHLEAEAKSNREMAARLSLLKYLADGENEHEEGIASSPALTQVGRAPRRSLRRAVIFLLFLSGGVGLSWAGWTVFTPKPILRDDFNKNWGDRDVWNTPRRTVTVEDGHVRLFDRGYLVTRGEYPGPIDLRFRWRWTDLAGDFHYRDELAVVLRTSGEPGGDFPFEIRGGLKIGFNATGGLITADWIDPQKPKLIGVVHKLPLPAGTWFRIRITDDGNAVTIYIAQDHEGEQGLQTPVARFELPDTATQHRIAFYNRERLALVSHESWIDDVAVYKFAEAAPPAGK